MVTNNTYKVGTAVRIIKESGSYSCYNTVVMCCREENQWARHVAVYVLLDNFKPYGPLVVVKGT